MKLSKIRNSSSKSYNGITGMTVLWIFLLIKSQKTT